MQKRVVGIEREVELFPPLYHDLYKSDGIGAAFYSLLPRMRNGQEITPPNSQYMANGGRSYIDAGDHPETATPECGSVRDCVIWDKANERILEDIAACLNAGTEMPGFGAGKILLPDVREKLARFGGLTFFKHNTGPRLDSAVALDRAMRLSSRTYASWGSHMNFLIDARAIPAKTAKPNLAKYVAASLLAPFCFSSAWLTGSGMVWLGERGQLAYSLSQRLPFVYALYSEGAQGLQKPMFKFQGKTYADEEKYDRLQCVGLDSSVCEWQTYVPLGVMALMLRMAEDHAVPLRDYDATIGQLLTLKEHTLWWGRLRKPFVFRGETHTVASLHRRYYLEPILRYKASGIPWSDEEEDIIRKYDFFIGLFEQSCSSRECAKLFAPYIGWAAKLWHLILPHMREYGYSFASASDMPLRITTKRGSAMRTTVWDRLRIFDREFHDVRREKSFYHALVRHGLIERIVTEDEILYAKEHAPSGTRAEARDKRILEIRSRDDIVLTSVEWGRVGYLYTKNNKREMTVNEFLDEPLSSNPRDFRMWRTS